MKLLFPKSFERQSKLSHVWQSLRVTDTPAQRGLVMLGCALPDRASCPAHTRPI